MENAKKPSSTTKILIMLGIIISALILLPGLLMTAGVLAPGIFMGLFPEWDATKTAPGDAHFFPKVALYKPAAPETLKDLSVSKTISTKDGGEIKLTDPQGVETTLFFFPESLEMDTEITMTPLKKFPLENYDTTLTPGVLIEPKSLKFKQPAFLTFSFKEETVPPAKDKNKLQSLLTINTAQAKEEDKENEEGYSNPPAFPDSGNPASHRDLFEIAPIGPAAIRSTNPGHGSIITSNDENGTSGVVPSTPQAGGSSVTGPISGGGSYAPDNLDGEEAKGLAGGSTEKDKDGGAPVPIAKCDQDMANIYAMAMAQDKANGIPEDANKAALNKCADEILDGLVQKCKTNKMDLRRKDFLLLQSLFSTVGDNDKRDATKKLMEGCTGRYSATGGQVFRAGGGSAHSQVSAETCGFIDDVWKGTYYFGTTIETANTEITFTLPERGGALYQKHEGGYSGYFSGGISTTAITGYFNGRDSFSQYGPRMTLFPVTINLVSSPCNK